MKYSIKLKCFTMINEQLIKGKANPSLLMVVKVCTFAIWLKHVKFYWSFFANFAVSYL
jgi:hypothetical protein